MFSKSKWVALILCLVFTTSTLFVETAYSAKPKYGSSSSSSSKPKYGSSKPPASKPPAAKPPTSSKPKYGTSSKPPTSSPPVTTPNSGSKPKYGTSNTTSGTTKPKYGTTPTAPITSKPSSGSPIAGPTSQKPPTTSTSQSRARDQAYSQRKYEETKAATAPPKPTYTAPNGKTVNVRTSSSTVQSIRTKPSTYYTPAYRTQRYDTIVVHNHYSHPYSWYSSQPYYYVGGGYSSTFWWIMMNEWSAERRARWLYHNQNTIERDAYERGMKDAAVAAELARLKSQNAAVNPDYVDPDFSENPDLMYSQEYVEAAYNPTVVPQPAGDPTVLLWVIGVIIIGGAIWFVVFRMKVTS